MGFCSSSLSYLFFASFSRVSRPKSGVTTVFGPTLDLFNKWVDFKVKAKDVSLPRSNLQGTPGKIEIVKTLIYTSTV